MSSPTTLDHSAFTVDSVTQTISENLPDPALADSPDLALRARAFMVVVLFSAGVWYLLWKLALFLIAGR